MRARFTEFNPIEITIGTNPSHARLGRLSAPGGSFDCTSTCTLRSEVGSEVTLVRSLQPGTQFDGWRGAFDCPRRERVCTFTVPRVPATGVTRARVAISATVFPETHVDPPRIRPNGGRVVVTFQLTGGVGPLDASCRLDPGPDDPWWTSCSSPSVLDGLTPGPHVVKVRASDGRGVPDPSPAVVRFTIDPPGAAG